MNNKIPTPEHRAEMKERMTRYRLNYKFLTYEEICTILIQQRNLLDAVDELEKCWRAREEMVEHRTKQLNEVSDLCEDRRKFLKESEDKLAESESRNGAVIELYTSERHKCNKMEEAQERMIQYLQDCKRLSVEVNPDFVRENFEACTEARRNSNE